MSNSGFCDDLFCQIRLVDVTDHTTCQVNVTGYPGAPNAFVTLNTDDIFINWGFYPFFAEPLYVNISCNT